MELLQEAPKGYHTQINDLMLSALSIAMSAVIDVDRICIGLEGHGREELHKKMDIYRTVGWFTSIYPIVLSIGSDVTEQILQTKEMLERVPKHGMGFGLMPKSHEVELDIYYNYLGEMGEGSQQEQAVFFQTGLNSAYENGMQGELNINGMIEKHCLNMNFVFDEHRILYEEIQRLVEAYKRAIRQVIKQCKQQGLLQLESVYPLSPLQRGMLYHYMAEERRQNYMIQTGFELQERAKEVYIDKALQLLSQTEPVLRTVLCYKGLQRSYQGIGKEKEIEFQVVSLQETDSWERVIEQDYERGFQLETDSLLRVLLVRQANKPDQLLWSYHHIILDGWSVGIIYEKFYRYYQELQKGKQAETILANETGESSTYEDYIRTVYGLGEEQGLEYWKTYLEGYEQIAQIPKDHVTESNAQVQTKICTIDLTEYGVLFGWLQEHHITVNTFVETMWGLLLQWYNRSQDVVFGKIISGREVALDGIEQMVGLLIQTVVVRIQTKPEETLHSVLKKVQQDGIKASEYGAISLAQIQGFTKQKADLIQSLYVFENYYRGEQNYQSYWNEVYTREETNYPITLIAGLNQNQLVLELMYREDEYESETMIRILKQMEGLMKQIESNPNQRIGDLERSTPEEEQLILYRFNQPELFDTKKTMLDLWMQQVRQQPNAIALTDGVHSLTYEQVNRKLPMA